MKTDLTQGEISKHILHIALPASIGFFFNTMFNVVDTYYAGKISNQALAALSLSFPAFLLILAISYGIGTASTALVGNSIGAGNKENIKLFASQSFSMGIFSSIFVAIIGLYFSKSIFKIFGAEGSYLDATTQYTNILFIFVFAFIIVQISSSLLSAYGDTKKHRNFLIFSFFLNLILDPILMYGLYGLPKLGIQGIALATVVTQLLGIPYLCHALIKIEVLDRDSIKRSIPIFKYYSELLYQAIPASLNMMTVALGFFVTTYYVSRFSQNAVAAFGVCTRIEQIILLPAIGLNISVLALISQNNGAENYMRVKQSYSICLKYGLILMSIGSIFTLLWSRFLISLFTDSSSAIEIGTNFLRIEAFAFAAYSSIYISTSALQGLKMPIFAVWLGVSRQIILPLVAMYILVDIFDFSITSIWWSRFFITVGAALFTVDYVYKIINQHNNS